MNGSDTLFLNLMNMLISYNDVTTASKIDLAKRSNVNVMLKDHNV